MSMTEIDMRVISIIGSISIVATLAVPTVWFTEAAGAQGPILHDLTAIEASIAVRKEKVTQPQKQFRPPDEPVKPTGVSHDEKKDPVPDKKDEPKPQHKDDPVSTDIDRFKHAPDDDPVGKPVTQVGPFNGSEKGYGDVTKGDPWLGQLNADMRFEPPRSPRATACPRAASTSRSKARSSTRSST